MAETTQKAQGRRKEVVGEVLSNKMHKTIVVQVTRKKAHPFYGRVIARNKKFYAHDEKNEAHEGDTVEIAECRPLSKTKRWEIVEITEDAWSEFLKMQGPAIQGLMGSYLEQSKNMFVPPFWR